MTRKEVVKWLESLKREIGKEENHTLWHYAEAIDMAIKALSADRPIEKQIDVSNETTSMISKQIDELRKYAKKWSEWSGFNAAMPVSPRTNIRLLRSAADIIEALDRPTGKWIEVDSFESEKHSVTDMRCSLCGKYASMVLPHRTRCVYDFCPNCGAEMRGEEE